MTTQTQATATLQTKPQQQNQSKNVIMKQIHKDPLSLYMYDTLHTLFVTRHYKNTKDYAKTQEIYRALDSSIVNFS